MKNYNRKILVSAFICAWILFTCLTSKATNKDCLDDQIFLSCELTSNIKKDIAEGYRAFIILPNTPIGNALNDVNNFLSKNQNDVIVFIFKDSVTNLGSKLNQHQIIKFIAIPEQNKLDNLSACKQNGKQLFIFTPGKTPLSYATKNQICDYTVPNNFPQAIESGFSGNSANNLVLFDIDKNFNKYSDSLQLQPELIPELFNKHTGKLPNFFLTRNANAYFHYKILMEKHAWYTANVTHDDKPLHGISWKEIPEMVSHGKIHTYEGNISPQKNGFRFSPDVFRFNKINSVDTKFFIATPKELDDELALSLEFDKNINNLATGTIEAAHSNISYVKDTHKGWCASFNGESQYIDYATAIPLQENITVSVWVNPTKIDYNRSIIGKGEAFSVKIREGKLLFTSPDIKDHSSDSIVVRKNEWQQLTFVFSAAKNVRFFRNGLFVGEKKVTETNHTNQSLLIGTNLWDEYFEGMMDDLRIWNRALNDEEVNLIYTQNIDIEKSFETTQIVLLALLAFIVSLRLFFRKKISFKRNEKNLSLQNTKPETSTVLQEELAQIDGASIRLFGGFHVVNREGKDLTALFSTRRKQLFIIVLIDTFRKGGISSKKLTDNLWPGHSIESAKNNKSTQTQRLRDILSQKTGIHIDFKNKKWKINLEDDVYCDIKQYFVLLNQLKNENQLICNTNLLEEFLSIIEKGALLPNMEEEWLDEFKSKVSDELLECLLPLYNNKEYLKNNKLVLRLSDTLLTFDPLNEMALTHKVNTLYRLEKKTLALECLEHFSKYYQKCYNQPFDTSTLNPFNKNS